jgi:hypothetical protein
MSEDSLKEKKEKRIGQCPNAKTSHESSNGQLHDRTRGTRLNGHPNGKDTRPDENGPASSKTITGECLGQGATDIELER